MRVCFFRSDKPREHLLAEAFIDGVREAGDEGVIREIPEDGVAEDCQVVAMIGVKSKELYRRHWKAGINVVYLDKGYLRHQMTGPIRLWEYWRVAVNAHHPTDMLMGQLMDNKRVKPNRSKLILQEWREDNPKKKIIVAGSSAKYHEFYDLPDPTTYAEKLVRRLRVHSDRKIIYRPKPTWKDAVEISGTRFSSGGEKLEALFPDAHCLVTHGSNSCFDAILAGIPTIVLGSGVSRDISSTELSDVESPLMVSKAKRRAWLANLMYWQYTMQEFRSGEPWRFIKNKIYGAR